MPSAFERKLEQCWQGIGTICLELKDWEGADQALTHLSGETKSQLEASYMKACADISAQGALINTLKELDGFTSGSMLFGIFIIFKSSSSQQRS